MLQTSELTLQLLADTQEPIYVGSCNEASIIFEWLNDLVSKNPSSEDMERITQAYDTVREQHLKLTVSARHAIGCLVCEQIGIYEI